MFDTRAALPVERTKRDAAPGAFPRTWSGADRSASPPPVPLIADRPACEAETVEEKHERLSSDAEYQRLGAVLKDIDREGWETASGVATFRLSMLTGCRTSEIPTLR